MTTIKKPVKRVFNSSMFRRGLIVILDPVGFIRFREKSSRREYSLSIEGAYWFAVKYGKMTKGNYDALIAHEKAVRRALIKGERK